MTNEPKFKSLKWRASALLLKATLIISILVVGSYYINQFRILGLQKWERAYSELSLAITKTKVVREYVKLDEASIDELVHKSAKEHRVPEIALKAIIFQESAGGSDKWLYRFEPTVYEDRSEKDSKYSDDERRMRSSSHGITQVMGYNAEPRCGVHWSKLYQPATAIDCGARILAQELKSHDRIEDSAEKLREAFRSYNGKGTRAERYADKAMAKVGELLLREATTIIAENKSGQREHRAS